MRLLRAAARVTLEETRQEDGEVGPVQEPVNVRPGRGAGFSMDKGPDPSAEQQYEAYRGTIYAVTTKIADRFARVPTELFQVEVQEDGTEERFPVGGHSFVQLLGKGVGRSPNREDSVYEFKRGHQLSMDLTGEAWWLVQRDAQGRPAEVNLLPANRMTIVFEEETGQVGGYLFQPKGLTGATAGMGSKRGIFVPKLPFEELHGQRTLPFVVFFRYPSPRGVEDPRGWSPVKAAAHAWDINAFEMVYKREFLKNGAQLGGILQSELALEREQIREYTEQFKEMHAGAMKAGQPLVLPKFLKWETTEPTPRDAQWVETVELTRTEILEIYATSESQLGQADVGNRATADAMEAQFARDVVQPRLTAFEQKLEGSFLPIYPGQDERTFFDVEHENPVPKDREWELKQEEQDVKQAVRTRNEVRQERGLEPYGTFGDRVPVPVSELIVDPWAGSDGDDGSDGDGAAVPVQDPGGDEDDDTSDDDADGQEGDADDEDEVEQGMAAYGLVAVAPVQRQMTEDEARQLVTMIFGAETAQQTYDQLVPILEQAIAEEGKLAMELASGGALEFDPARVKDTYLRAIENRVKGIGKTTSDAVYGALADGIGEGEGARSLANRVRGVFTDAETWRAQAIARTEAIGAHNFARDAAWKQSGAEAKEWVSTMDGWVRETHEAANGQVVPVNGYFSVGVSRLSYPGDPGGAAEEVVNCRCTSVPATLEDGEGRSIFDKARKEALWRQFAAGGRQWERRVEQAMVAEFREQRRRVISAMAQMMELAGEAL